MKGKNFTSAGREDNVYTPYSMTRQLFNNVYFDREKTVLEPACGEKLAIVKVLREEFNKNFINYFDKNIPEYSSLDFLKIRKDQIIPLDYIITNPPYSQLDEFIIKAKEIAKEKFAFLCKITHLGGFSRFQSEIFKDKTYPLTNIFMFTRQANLKFTSEYPDLREDSKYPAGMYYYIWLIWEKHKEGYYDFPKFSWINNQEYILNSKDFN
jgi:hypothetical protein